MHITIQQLLSDKTSDFRDYYIESKHDLSTTYINSKLRAKFRCKFCNKPFNRDKMHINHTY